MWSDRRNCKLIPIKIVGFKDGLRKDERKQTAFLPFLLELQSYWPWVVKIVTDFVDQIVFYSLHINDWKLCRRVMGMYMDGFFVQNVVILMKWLAIWSCSYFYKKRITMRIHEFMRYFLLQNTWLSYLYMYILNGREQRGSHRIW